MNVQEFAANHYEDGEVFSSVSQEIICVDQGDEQIEHKTSYNVDVWQVVGTDEYFEVTHSRDNCGYWSDGERHEPEFRKVKPVKKVVEIIEWKAA